MISYNHRLPIRRFLCTVGISLFILMPACPAGAQSRDAKIERLENEIQTLNRAVFKGEMPPADSLAVGDNVSAVNAANTEVRLQQIEMDLRKLTGTVEENSFRQQQFEAKMEQVIAELQMRMSAIEARNGGAAPGMTGGYDTYSAGPGKDFGNGSVSSGLQNLDASTAADSAGDFETQSVNLGNDAGAGPAEPPPTMGNLGVLHDTPPTDTTAYAPAQANDPVGIYEQAFSYLKDKNFEQAEAGFKDFLSRYPQHDLAANAQYWLGESYYARNEFDKAARTFAEAYQKYPKGPKGPDNLLKLGMALSALGKKDDACLSYSQLGKDYPNGAMPILSRAEQEMDRLGCSRP